MALDQPEGAVRWGRIQKEIWVFRFTLFSAMQLWLLLCLTLLLPVDCALPPYQVTALNNFFSALSGPSWVNKANWAGSTDPCTGWFGVFCDATATNVATILLPANNLTGALPDLNLPGLTDL